MRLRDRKQDNSDYNYDFYFSDQEKSNYSNNNHHQTNQENSNHRNNNHYQTNTQYQNIKLQPQKIQTFSSYSSNSIKKSPKQQDLCKAIKKLRQKLPNRSLQQIIMRLYQAVDIKNSQCGQNTSNNFDKKSVNSRAHDFDDQQSLFNGKSFVYQKQNEGETSRRGDELSQLKSQGTHKIELNKMQEQTPLQYQNNAPQAQQQINYQPGINYIYRPKGKQIIQHYKASQNVKTQFINKQEQDKYASRRVMARSFIERGYGVQWCRHEIKAQQAKNVILHRNTYKTLSGSVIILAYRKLQSFIANDCSKTIKYLDRWQMRSICTPMLNCRTTMENEQMQTLFKYIQASYGLRDVIIGEIQSVKLYLACQKFIYGKNVTMEMLERMGEVQHRKNIQLTLQYLTRKKQRREQRLHKLRVMQKNRKIEESSQLEANKDTQNLQMEDIMALKIEDGFLESEMEVKIDDEWKQQEGLNNKKQGQHSQINEDVKVKQQEQTWTQAYEHQYANYLLSGSFHLASSQMKLSHPQLQSNPLQFFHKKYKKILKRSIKKIQIQIQIILDYNGQIQRLSKLSKQQMRWVCQQKEGDKVRELLLMYYLRDVPEEEKLFEVVHAVKEFLNFCRKRYQEEEGEELIDLANLQLGQEDGWFNQYQLQKSQVFQQQ